MMREMGELWRHHLRLTIIRLLEKAPDYATNESILHDAVRALGVRVTRDQVRGEIAWLAEQGLVEIEDLDGLTIATATRRGVEVAQGLASHPGVKRPSPKG